MADLEEREKMTPYQLTVVITATAFGAQAVLAPQKIIEKDETGTIVSIMLGGMLFFGIAWMMLKLGEHYPKETLVEYMPRLWGNKLGTVILWWFAAVFLVQCSVILNGFGKAITLFMFDRTPNQVVQIGILAVTVYCTMQDFGTILRVQQITLFVSGTILTLMWSTALLNFRFENLLPFMSKGISGVLQTVPDTWSMYSGYEILLLLLPLVHRGKAGVTKPVAVAFVILILAFEFLFVVVIGVMTAKAAANSPYPTIITMRAVELPGTFIERLENYLILAWVPAVFDTLVVLFFSAAQAIARRYGYADHRPIVLLLTPLLFIGSILMVGAKAVEAGSQLLNWIGYGFSFAIVPISLILAWRQKRGINSAKQKD